MYGQQNLGFGQPQGYPQPNGGGFGGQPRGEQRFASQGGMGMQPNYIPGPNGGNPAVQPPGFALDPNGRPPIGAGGPNPPMGQFAQYRQPPNNFMQPQRQTWQQRAANWVDPVRPAPQPPAPGGLLNPPPQDVSIPTPVPSTVTPPPPTVTPPPTDAPGAPSAPPARTLTADQNGAIYNAFAQHANNPQLIHQLAKANNISYQEIAGAMGQPMDVVQRYFTQAGLSL